MTRADQKRINPPLWRKFVDFANKRGGISVVHEEQRHVPPGERVSAWGVWWDCFVAGAIASSED